MKKLCQSIEFPSDLCSREAFTILAMFDFVVVGFFVMELKCGMGENYVVISR